MDGPSECTQRTLIREFSSDRHSLDLLANAFERIAPDLSKKQGQNLVHSSNSSTSTEPQEINA
jgi:hypothetical protein